MVRGLHLLARFPVDFAGGQPVGGLGRQQEVVDAQTLVVVEGAAVVPIAIEMRFRVERPVYERVVLLMVR